MADNDKPWPLVVVYTADLEAERNYSPDALLESAMTALRLKAVKMLEEAGRMGDVRRLKLFCYDSETKD